MDMAAVERVRNQILREIRQEKNRIRAELGVDADTATKIYAARHAARTARCWTAPDGSLNEFEGQDLED